MLSVLLLRALAHAPATAYELRFLTGLIDRELLQQANDLMWPERLIVGHRDGWDITDAGRKTLQLIEAYVAGQRRDAECQGVGQ